MPDETQQRLETTAEEGLRMERHPGIVFRAGPAGRRPGLAGGPDVWEVVRVVRNVEARVDRAIAEAASWLGLSAVQVRIAVEYYVDYPAEIDAWIAKVDAQAVEAEEFQRGGNGTMS